MIYLQTTLALAALGTVMSYARRINDVSWRTHRATCVLAQLTGGLASAAILGWSVLTSPLGLVLCWAILGTLWYHLAATASAWRFGPPLTATKHEHPAT